MSLASLGMRVVTMCHWPDLLSFALWLASYLVCLIWVSLDAPELDFSSKSQCVLALTEAAMHSWEEQWKNNDSQTGPLLADSEHDAFTYTQSQILADRMSPT